MNDVRSRLTEEDIREVLVRAEAIHRGGANQGGLGTDAEDFIRAAEESGLPREAVEQALRERLQIPLEPPKTGDRVFAKSSDGCYYVAEVMSETASGLRVKFLRGGEHTVPLSDIKACGLLPGERVHGFFKDWGWYPVTVVSFNEATKRVKLNDWWGTESIPISEIRLQPPKPLAPAWQTFLYNHGVGFLAGVGASVLAWLLLR